MPINFNLKGGGCQPQNDCPNYGCPDFTIRRHDTKPTLKVSVEDCNGPMDFRGLVVEVNMWSKSRIKDTIDDVINYIKLADKDIFEQIMVGDIIIMDRPRLPEQMLVTGFDEANYLIQVQRGYHGTTPQGWKRGSHLRIFRTLNSPAEAEMTFTDVTNVDGTKDSDVIQDAYLVYEWQPTDTCLPGYYWLEFKVLKMIDIVWFTPGGHWEGATFTDTSNGFIYTGASLDDGSVRLSYDQVTGYFLLPCVPWQGPTHVYMDGNTYTGTAHTASSVMLNKTGVPFPDNTGFDSDGGILRTIWFLQPGYWNGVVHQWTDNNYYTGSSHSDSSVLLTLNQANSMYSIAGTEWSGAFHSFGENIYYTGSTHNDGSVVLDRNEIAWTGGFTSDSGFSLACLSNISLTPSFVDISLTPTDFGCTLGEGVEWVRRFPLTGEGFLIKIEDSPTAEL